MLCMCIIWITRSAEGNIILRILKASPKFYGVPSDPKNWTVGRPGNEARGLVSCPARARLSARNVVRARARARAEEVGHG